jgi:hypothetical protein
MKMGIFQGGSMKFKWEDFEGSFENACQAARSANAKLEEWLANAPKVDFDNVEDTWSQQSGKLPDSDYFTARLVDVRSCKD